MSIWVYLRRPWSKPAVELFLGVGIFTLIGVSVTALAVFLPSCFEPKPKGATDDVSGARAEWQFKCYAGPRLVYSGEAVTHHHAAGWHHWWEPDGDEYYSTAPCIFWRKSKED